MYKRQGDDGYYGNHGESLGIGGYSRNEGEQRFYVISDGGTTIAVSYTHLECLVYEYRIFYIHIVSVNDSQKYLSDKNQKYSW